MEQLEKLIRVRSVEMVGGVTVRIEFEDSTVKLLDLAPLMHGPIFDELLQDFELFKQIAVEHGTIAWPNGADIVAVLPSRPFDTLDERLTAEILR